MACGASEEEEEEEEVMRDMKKLGVLNPAIMEFLMVSPSSKFFFSPLATCISHIITYVGKNEQTTSILLFCL